MLIISALVFLAVSIALAGVYFWVAPSRTEQRLQGIAPAAAEKTEWTEVVLKVVSPLAKLSLPTGEWESSPLRLRFFHAGIRHRNARVIYFAMKTFLPLLMAGLVFFSLRAMNQSHSLTLLFYVLAAALIGCYLPNLVVYLTIRSRQREIFESFADAADLMLVCVEAGLGLDAALTKVSEEIKRKSQALAEELRLTNLEMRAGGTREKALRNLALRVGVEEIATFTTMLTQADKFGTSIGESLRVFSDDLRHKRQVRAEESAAKVPTKLLFPLVLFIFPSVFMVVLGPAIIQIIRTMLPMFSGQG
jgi:tight adherence protein C